MPELSRSQVLVYGAIGVTLLLLGVRWIQSSEQAAGSRPAAGGITVESGDGGGARGGAIVVHVAGAVRDAGVYRLPDGSRVADAVERAGGASGDAMLDGINLAARLADGQQVVVPAKVKGAATASAGGAATGDGPISLGMASAEQLETIEGIGPVTAGKIVEYRDQRGGVASIEELEEIHGIGPATIERLRERLQP